AAPAFSPTSGCAAGRVIECRSVTPQGVNGTFSHVELNSNLTLIGERVAAQEQERIDAVQHAPCGPAVRAGKIESFLGGVAAARLFSAGTASANNRARARRDAARPGGGDRERLFPARRLGLAGRGGAELLDRR